MIINELIHMYESLEEKMSVSYGKEKFRKKEWHSQKLQCG